MTEKLRKHRIHIFVLLALLLCWPAPYFSSLRSPNELVRLYLTRAWVDDHTIKLDTQIKKYGPLTDYALRDGHYYCDKAPGLSWMSAPLYRLFSLTSPNLSEHQFFYRFRLMCLILPTLCVLLLLCRQLDRLRLQRRLVEIMPIAIILCTPLFAYNLQWMSHAATAWLLGLTTALIWYCRSQTIGWSILPGFCAAFAVTVEYPVAPLLLPLAITTVWNTKQRLHRLAFFVLGTLPPLAALSLYHVSAFGNVWQTGYAFLANPQFQNYHRHGIFGVGLPNWEALSGVLLSAKRGLLLISPWFIFAPFSLLALRKPQWHPWLFCFWAQVVWMFYSAVSFPFWLGGWSFGPRHLVAALLPLAILSFVGFDMLRKQLSARAGGIFLEITFFGLLLVGGIACTTAALTYPSYPEDINAPLFELSLPLLSRGQFPNNLASLLGFSKVTMWPALLFAVLLLTTLRVGMLNKFLQPLKFSGALALALGFFVVGYYFRPPVDASSLFRVAWLTQTMWEPKEAIVPTDPRLALWEKAKQAVEQGSTEPHYLEALGATSMYIGDLKKAQYYFSLAELAR